MPRLVVGYAELVGGKLKKGNGFLQPNFGAGPSLVVKWWRVYAFSTELRGQMDWLDWVEGWEVPRAGT
jgi:hypothetical protein